MTLTPSDVERILAVWQRRLRIGHWSVRLMWDSLIQEDDRHAEITHEDCYDRATIRVTSAYEGWSLREANVTIAHELMHLVLRDLQHAVESAEGVLPSTAYKLFLDRFEHELEGVVERIAGVLVDLGGLA